MEKNALVTTAGKFQNYYMSEIKLKFEKIFDKPMDDVTRQIAVSTLMSVVETAYKNEVELNRINNSSVFTCIESLIGSGINPTGSKLVYFKLEKASNDTFNVVVEPQADGFYQLLRKFGANIKDYVTTWLIREGDDFTNIEWVGIEQTPPRWTSRSTTNKVVRVVVIVRLNDGSIDYSLQAERGNVIPSIIAQVRNSNRYMDNIDEILKDFLKFDDVDKLLDKYQFLKGKNGKYENYILGPAWRDHRDSMIVRKMINFAIKQRPKIDTADYFQQKAMNTLIDETHVYDYKEVDFVEKGKEETEQVILKTNKPKLQIEDEKENKEIEYEVKVENEVEEKEYEKVEDDIVEEVEDETIKDEEIDVVEVEIKNIGKKPQTKEETTKLDFDNFLNS